MNNQMIYGRELPTLEFIMSEMMQQKAQAAMPENQNPGKLFYLFAALQVPLILGGAAVGLFVAPLSLFVSTTEAEYVGWIVIALIALLNLALGLLVLPLGIAAAIGLSKEKKWGKVVGIAAASLAVLQFPVGTIGGGCLLLWKLFRRG